MQLAPQNLTQPSGSSTASGQQHEQAEDKSQTLVTDILDQHSESCMGTFAHLDSQLQANCNLTNSAGEPGHRLYINISIDVMLHSL